MSAEILRSERVTLSAAEREALICDCADSPPSACVVHGVGYNLALHCPDDLVARVERILAAREQALREATSNLQARLDAIATYAGHPGNWGASDARGRLIRDLATGAIDPASRDWGDTNLPTTAGGA